MKTMVEDQIDLSIFEPYKVNCKKCCGLCCVALYFSKLDGFPKDKEAGTACPNLEPGYTCKVHSALSAQGLKGCMHYDCFGAGQFVTRSLSLSPDWSSLPSDKAETIFHSYLVVLRVHQMLWHLSQCLILRIPPSEKEQAKLLIAEGSQLITDGLETCSIIDTEPFCHKSSDYLKQIGALCMSYVSGLRETPSADYMGKDMRKKNLDGKDFSMALLIAADLEQASLCGANFLGADMRDTNVRNTNLSQCLFLSQIQINSAKGNRQTVLPPYLCRPDTWETA